MFVSTFFNILHSVSSTLKQQELTWGWESHNCSTLFYLAISHKFYTTDRLGSLWTLRYCFIQAWQIINLVFNSIQSLYIDFKIPPMCFIISLCSNKSTHFIMQRRETFYSLFVCKELLWLLKIYYNLSWKSLGPTRRRKAHGVEWQSFLRARAILHIALKRRRTAHGLIEWLPSRALRIWCS